MQWTSLGLAFNPFQSNGPLLYSLETFGFLMFLGDVKMEYWPKNWPKLG